MLLTTTAPSPQSTPLVVGLGVAAAAFVGKQAVQQYVKFMARPAGIRAFYKVSGKWMVCICWLHDSLQHSQRARSCSVAGLLPARDSAKLPVGCTTLKESVFAVSR